MKIYKVSGIFAWIFIIIMFYFLFQVFEYPRMSNAYTQGLIRFYGAAIMVNIWSATTAILMRIEK